VRQREWATRELEHNLSNRRKKAIRWLLVSGLGAVPLGLFLSGYAIRASVDYVDVGDLPGGYVVLAYFGLAVAAAGVCCLLAALVCRLWRPW
jgi:hypothetical protein